MKKLSLSLLLIFTLLLFVVIPADDIEARRGCCSHHGGVCGCRCCDGTSLSAKCAPYYPECGTQSIPKYEPPAPKHESPAPKEISPIQQYDLPVQEKYTAETPNRDNSGVSIWWWIIGIGVAGYVFYTLGKRKNN